MIEQLYETYDNAKNYFMKKENFNTEKAHEFAIVAMFMTNGIKSEPKTDVQTYYGGTNLLD